MDSDGRGESSIRRPSMEGDDDGYLASFSTTHRHHQPQPPPPTTTSNAFLINSFPNYQLHDYSLPWTDTPTANPDCTGPAAPPNLPSTTLAPAPGQPTTAPRGASSRKRARASRRTPTTVLTTDTSNFRQMVQEFTGIPSPPFTSTPSSPFAGRARPFDLFRSAAAVPPSLLQRPFASSKVLAAPIVSPFGFNFGSSSSTPAASLANDAAAIIASSCGTALGMQSQAHSLQSLQPPPDRRRPPPGMSVASVVLGIRGQEQAALASTAGDQDYASLMSAFHGLTGGAGGGGDVAEWDIHGRPNSSSFQTREAANANKEGASSGGEGMRDPWDRLT